MLEGLANRASRSLEHPGWLLASLIALAGALEAAQYVPEFFLGAHALGEVARNLSYALIGAVAFHWLVVEIPTARRRRATYAFHRTAFNILLVAGPGLFRHPYQHAADQTDVDVDIGVWDHTAVSTLATVLSIANPLTFGPQRLGLLRATVEVGIPRALAELSHSASYLDADVAHALSQFPHDDGISVLQVRPTADGGVEPRDDAYITWSLVEAARRLYRALMEAEAYPTDICEGYVEDADGVVLRLTADLLADQVPSRG